MQNCQKCGVEFSGESWAVVCRKCWAENKKNQTTKPNSNGIESRDKLIIRQTLFKCASEVMERGSNAKQVIIFVKELEEGFYQ